MEGEAMSLILKGIDLPSKGEDVTIEINSSGYVRAYSTVPMVYDSDIQAIQISRGHGRIGDLDELQKAIKTDIMGGLNYEYFIRNAPTILESEENDEFNT